MTKIISIHSFRGGTGKSNITANLAFLLFSQGKRVAIIDGDVASPGIHILYGLQNENIKCTLNDYLSSKCTIQETAIDVSKDLKGKGSLFIIPSRLDAVEITRILREGYNVEHLIDGINKIAEELKLDYLLIDTHPGLKEETLLALSVSDVLFVVMRPDNQDYQGTSVIVELAKKLEVPNIYIIINKILPSMGIETIEEKVKEAYNIKLAATLPFSEEMLVLGSSDLFTKKFPDHALTTTFKKLLEYT